MRTVEVRRFWTWTSSYTLPFLKSGPLLVGSDTTDIVRWPSTPKYILNYYSTINYISLYLDFGRSGPPE
jgi:hypothetical protein